MNRDNKNLEQELWAIHETLHNQRHVGIDMTEVIGMMELEIMREHNLSPQQLQCEYQRVVGDCGYDINGQRYCRNTDPFNMNTCPYRTVVPDETKLYRCTDYLLDEEL